MKSKTLKTRTFRDLHGNSKKPLILPNVWDVAGARLVESLGAKAVATTSAPVDASVSRVGLYSFWISSASSLKAVSCFSLRRDSRSIERRFSQSSSFLRLSISCYGMLIGEPTAEAIKKMASSLGVDIFVNARTDVYLQDLVADEKKVQETLDRAAVYRSVGADGLFVPGLTDTAHIAQITKGTDLPVNLMASPELPNADGLAKLNVRRLSAGTALAQIAYKHVARLAENFLRNGDCKVFNEDTLQYSQLQDLFDSRD